MGRMATVYDNRRKTGVAENGHQRGGGRAVGQSSLSFLRDSERPAGHIDSLFQGGIGRT